MAEGFRVALSQVFDALVFHCGARCSTRINSVRN